MVLEIDSSIANIDQKNQIIIRLITTISKSMTVVSSNGLSRALIKKEYRSGIPAAVDLRLQRWFLDVPWDGA